MNVRSRRAGFTLIELMVVLAILAIIMMIAVPAYNDQVRRANRSEAIARINDLVLAQERWRSENPAYATDAELTTPDLTKYAVAVSNPTATNFVIEATASGDQVNDKVSGVSCTPLRYERTANPQRTPAACWR